MKKFILIIFIVSFVVQAKAQSFEFSVQANSGVSHFTGKTTVNTTFLNAGMKEHTGYANGTGNINTPTLGAGLQLQYVFKCNFIVGGQAGFEQFNSKVNIDTINGSYNSPIGHINGTYQAAATGHVTNHWDYINLNPYIGYRFTFDKVRLDVMPGIDIAIGTGSSETVNVKASDGTYYNKPNIANGTPSSDVRLRMGLAVYYQHLGITASYSRGLKDYNSGLMSDSFLPPLHTGLLRIGLAYQIK